MGDTVTGEIDIYYATPLWHKSKKQREAINGSGHFLRPLSARPEKFLIMPDGFVLKFCLLRRMVLTEKIIKMKYYGWQTWWDQK